MNATAQGLLSVSALAASCRPALDKVCTWCDTVISGGHMCTACCFKNEIVRLDQARQTSGPAVDLDLLKRPQQHWAKLATTSTTFAWPQLFSPRTRSHDMALLIVAFLLGATLTAGVFANQHLSQTWTRPLQAMKEYVHNKSAADSSRPGYRGGHVTTQSMRRTFYLLDIRPLRGGGSGGTEPAGRLFSIKPHACDITKQDVVYTVCDVLCSNEVVPDALVEDRHSGSNAVSDERVHQLERRLRQLGARLVLRVRR